LDSFLGVIISAAGALLEVSSNYQSVVGACQNMAQRATTKKHINMSLLLYHHIFQSLSITFEDVFCANHQHFATLGIGCL